MANRTLNIILLAFGLCSCDNTKMHKVSNRSDYNPSSITWLRIHYQPSFTNSCVLEIDKNKNHLELKVDSVFLIKYAGLTSFWPLVYVESNSQIEKFYNPKFLKTIEFNPKTERVLDGISLMVYYSADKGMDSICTGNNLSPELRKIQKELIKFLAVNTQNSNLKSYLDDLSTYFQ